MSEPPLRVYILLSLGVISFAFAPILVRLAGDVPGLAIAVWRTVTAASVLVPVAAFRVGSEVRAFSRWDVVLILCAGGFLGLHFIVWIESLFHTTVASASVLVTLSPIILAVLGYFLLGERLAWLTAFAIITAVGGAVLITWADAGSITLGRGALFGNSLALSGALFVSVYLLIGRVVRQKVSWLAYVTPLYATAALTAVIGAGVGGVPLFGYSWSVYAVCAGLAIGPQILGHGSFNYALQYMPAALVGMLALLEPVGASILAYFLFGEIPPVGSILGMVIVLVAVAIVVLRREARSSPSDSESSTDRG